MSQPLRFSMLITADATAAERSVDDLRQDVTALGEDAKATASDIGQMNAALEEASTAAARARTAMRTNPAEQTARQSAFGPAANGPAAASGGLDRSGLSAEDVQNQARAFGDVGEAATQAATGLGLYHDAAGRLRNARGQYASAEERAAAQTAAATGALADKTVATERASAANDNLSRGLRQTDGTFTSLIGSARALGPLMAGLAATMGVGLGLGAGITGSIGRLEENARLERRLESVMSATGYAAGLSLQQITGFADELERSTGRAAEETVAAAARLATFTSITEENFLQAIRAADAMAEVYGGDLQSNIEAVARAMENPIEGMAALQRQGFRLTDSQKALLTEMVRVNDVAGQQAFILDMVSDTSNAAADAFTGLRRARAEATKAVEDFFDALVVESGVLTALEATLRASASSAILLAENLDTIAVIAAVVGARLAAPAIISLATILIAQARAAGAMAVQMNLVNLSLAGAVVQTRALAAASALVGGPWGLALTGVAAGIAFWATRTNEATSALEEHERIVGTVRSAYQAAGGDVDVWARKIENVTLLQARENLRQQQALLKSQLDEVRMPGSGNRRALMQQGFGDRALAEEMAELDSLVARLRAGDLSVAAFRARLDTIGENTAAPAVRDLTLALQNQTEEALKTEKRVVEVGASVDVLAGTMSSATVDALGLGDALDGVGRSAEGSAMRLLRLREAAQKTFRESLDALRGRVPDGRTERELIEAEFQAGANAARNTEQSPRALEGRMLELTRLRDQALAQVERREATAREGHQLDLQSINARTAAQRAFLEGERVRLSLIGQNIDEAEKERRVQEAIELSYARSRQEAEDAARQRLTSRSQEIEQLQLEIALIGRSASERARLTAEHRMMQELTQTLAEGGVVDPAEFEMIRRTAAEIGRLTEQTVALGQAREQADSLRRLEVEASLIGANGDARRRALATLEAEMSLQRAGIDLNSEWGRSFVENAVRISDFETAIRQQADAFGLIQKAGESAIDTIFDGFLTGAKSIEDIFSDLAGSITQIFTELAVKNPLKNALFGGDLPTMDSVGGLSGILGFLRGERPDTLTAPSLAAPALGATPLTPMYVSLVGAGIVGLGGGAGDAITRLLNPANSNSSTALDAAAKAIRTMESGSAAGNYSILGPATRTGDRAHGAYQIMGANIGPWSQAALGRRLSSSEFLANPSLQDQIFQHRFGGYMQKYGPEGAARAWFAGEGGMNRMGAQDVLGTSVSRYGSRFSDLYARHGGGAAASREMETSAQTMAGAANAIGSTATAFASGLDLNSKVMINGMEGTIGSFLPKFGGNLERLLQAVQGGGGAGGGIGSLFGAPKPSAAVGQAIASGAAGLFSGGGYTGPGGVHEPAGVVHRGEVVWSQADVRRAGGVQVVEAMRLGLAGYSQGGVVGGAPAAVMPSITIIDQRSAGSSEPVRAQPTSDGHSIEVLIRDRARDELTTSGRPGNSLLEDTYGLRAGTIRR